ncbi:class I SAM-dependent methyltransferase [Bdellovibrio sp. HCB209]|uniref:class I SAM-dependent methyltransferase n=1 Tax=Bdellovibrio sp. HCB209 TaxID=3394354 RepID=UPI0039B69DC0
MSTLQYFAALLSISLSVIAFAKSSEKTDIISTAISNPQRPATDKEVDAHRHPAEILKFSQVKSGDTVVEFLPGRGYYTRLFSSVVGPKGKVILATPKELEGNKFKIVETAQELPKGLDNVTSLVIPVLEQPAASADVFFTSQNYHDLRIKEFIYTDIAAFNKMVFKMLKPGGRYIVIDHVAKEGSTLEEDAKLHRIDPKMVRKELEEAGFKFDGESTVLKSNEDHTLNVFDPKIKGKTDQFVYRFVKPKK